MRNFHFTILLPFVFIQGIFFQSVNGQQIDNINKSPKYPNYKLKVEKLLEFGAGDLTKEKYLLGRAADIALDSHGNVYICDDISAEVKKFDKNRKYIKTIGSGKGRGPGEFITPRRIQLDENDNLFVLDFELRRLTQFDRNGNFLRTLPFNKMKPGEFAIRNGLVYVLGFRLYKTPPIQIIDLNTGQMIGAFGDRTADSLLVARVGSTGSLTFKNKEIIYYADYYPYRISSFSADGNPLFSFSRHAPFIKPPKQIPSQRRPGTFYVRGQGGIRGIGILNPNYLMVLIDKLDGEEQKHNLFVDIFDQSGTWLLTIPLAKYFNISWTRHIIADKKGNVYLTSDDPFPHVEKFSIDLRDENGNVIMQ